jgi:hypothetical protein
MAKRTAMTANEARKPAILPQKPRWRVRQAEEDEMDEALLGLGTEKDGSSGK